ncbi:MAG TPA: hypothetical protein VD970_03860 [Acetobacteraceae bacterium]|nr:hypothetical protein [Acetobacteraceae bacterium]
MACDLSGARILVVEDDGIQAMTLCADLEESGAQVLGPAASAEKAVELVKAVASAGGISAAVLDVKLRCGTSLPVADALDVLDVPFIFATGYGCPGVLGRHAAAPVVEKPYTRPALVSALRPLLGRGRTESRLRSEALARLHAARQALQRDDRISALTMARSAARSCLLLLDATRQSCSAPDRALLKELAGLCSWPVGEVEDGTPACVGPDRSLIERLLTLAGRIAAA